MTKELATRGAANYSVVKDFFQSSKAKSNLAMALPKHLSADRMLRVVLSATLRNPTLLECTKESLFAAMLTCSEMGLEPDGRHIYLIPFRNNKKDCMDVQVIPSYMGYIKLAYQSGHVLSISAKPVYEGDEFQYSLGTGQFLRHEPADKDRGALTHAWAMARLKGGGENFVVLNRTEVMDRKKASKAANSGPWKTHEPQMWAKSAVRELVKFIPISPQLTAATVADTNADLGEGVILDMEADPPPPDATKSERVADELFDKSPTATESGQ